MTRTLLHFRGGPRDGQGEPYGVDAARHVDDDGHPTLPAGYHLETVETGRPHDDHLVLRWTPDPDGRPRRLPDSCCEPVHRGCVLWRQRRTT